MVKAKKVTAVAKVQEPASASPVVESSTQNTEVNVTIVIDEQVAAPDDDKKRGRRPKGGKLVSKRQDKNTASNQQPNIILHLKCSRHDLNEYKNQQQQIVTDPLAYNPVVPPNIMTYNDETFSTFSEYVQNAGVSEKKVEPKRLAYSDVDTVKLGSAQYCAACSVKLENDETKDDQDDSADVNIKDVNQKLKRLKINLYKNANPDKKSACFWCTYEYDNHPCYIPKYETNGEMFGYGSFCRPECAVAYLMKESIDDSTKFERYHLLNHIYSKVYGFKKNIKPAPSPYFLLEKYYGNLSIQEYRKLLKTEHMLLIIEKPMTRILPELHEDNEDFITNIYGGKSGQSANQSGVYKVKKPSDKPKGPSKSTIIKENFGFS